MRIAEQGQITDRRDKLKGFLGRLRGGRTLVLLGSRGAEEWPTAGQGTGICPSFWSGWAGLGQLRGFGIVHPRAD